MVSDISMPRLTGIDLLRAIRARDPDVPVILCTGTPDVKSAIEAVRLGALQYLTKPVDLEELKRVLARAVRLGRIARLKQEALTLLSDGVMGGGDLLALVETRAELEHVIALGCDLIQGYLVAKPGRPFPNYTW